MDSELRDILWESHQRQWEHCLRCKLAELRLTTDKDRRKSPSRVPLAAGVTPTNRTASGARRGAGSLPPHRAAVYVLYSCPDTSQEQASSVFGSRDATGESTSPSHGLMEWSWDALAQVMPFPISDVAFGLAFGCRPVSFSDPRKLMKAKGEYIKACRPRWTFEVLLTDPELVLICGRHALAAVRPDLATQHSRLIGEVIQLELPTPHGPALYEGYITVSPEEVVQNARDDHYEIHEWSVSPEHSHVDHPVRHWLWHLLYATWLAQTLRDISEGREPADMWGGLLRQMDTYYRERTTVSSLLERRSDLFARVEQIAADELSGKGARFLQLHDAPAEVLEDEDDGDEEGDDSDSIEEADGIGSSPL